MTRAPYAGRERLPKPLALSPRAENKTVQVLRQLRSYVAGTPGLTHVQLLDKIDDTLFKVRGK